MTRSPLALACLGWLLSLTTITTAISAEDQEPKPAIRIRLTKPDEQLRVFLRLFEGARAPSPAVALAGWKRASREPDRLGKPLEALIAALNPRMVGELKTLNNAEVSIWFDPLTGRPDWSAILPEDDGTFAALGSAFVLSGGLREDPLGEVVVDRLAGPGSPLMAKVAAGTWLANRRAAMVREQDRLQPAPGIAREGLARLDGISVTIEPGSLQGSKDLRILRFAELIRPTNPVLNPLDGLLEFHGQWIGESFEMSSSYRNSRPIRPVTIDRAWLDWIPRDRAMVGFALALDPDPQIRREFWELADRVEKVDPLRAGVVSLPVRLELLANLVGIRAETDLLAHLNGVSGWIGSDGKQIDTVFLRLHLDDPLIAERIVAKVKPLTKVVEPAPVQPDAPRSLGQVEGKNLRIARLGREVILTWGDGVLEASIQARDQPERSAGPQIREFCPAIPATQSCLFAVWPGRIPGLWPAETPLAQAMAESGPIVGQGHCDRDSGLRIQLVWLDLKSLIRRFLDRIPLDPPPDH